MQDFVRNLVTNFLFFNVITIWLLKMLDVFNKNNTVKYVGLKSTEKTSEFPRDYFYKFSSFQAKIGLETISDVDIHDSLRIKNVNFINKNSKSMAYFDEQRKRNVYWQYLFIFERQNNKEIIETFKKHKVDTAQTSLPLLPYLENYGFNQETPIAKKIHENGYFIPAYHRLNHKDLLRISSAVDDIWFRMLSEKNLVVGTGPSSFAFLKAIIDEQKCKIDLIDSSSTQYMKIKNVCLKINFLAQECQSMKNN